jgi:DNA-binding NarL/FixJ family response regulator
MEKSIVLLADGNQRMLAGIRGLLETAFDSVVMVADRASLIQAADRLDPDLAVVDVSLRGVEGMNVAKHLKAACPRLKTIILSVHDETTVMDTIMKAGVEGLVLKRAIATDLLDAIDAVRKGDTYISPSLKRRKPR